MISEAEELYSYVADIFNIWSKSQYFLKEEQNFISANEIDNMVNEMVIMCFKIKFEYIKNYCLF